MGVVGYEGHAQVVVGQRFSRYNVAALVAAAVVDHNNLKRSGVVLLKQVIEQAIEACMVVARIHYDRHRTGFFRLAAVVQCRFTTRPAFDRLHQARAVNCDEQQCHDEKHSQQGERRY